MKVRISVANEYAKSVSYCKFDPIDAFKLLVIISLIVYARTHIC